MGIRIIILSGGLNSYTVKSTRTFQADQFLVITYRLCRTDETEAFIRYEVTPSYILVHPFLLRITKTSVQALSGLFEDTVHKVAKEFLFDEVFSMTTNEKMVKLITQNRAVKIASHQEGDIYVYEVNNV